MLSRYWESSWASSLVPAANTRRAIKSSGLPRTKTTSKCVICKNAKHGKQKVVCVFIGKNAIKPNQSNHHWRITNKTIQWTNRNSKQVDVADVKHEKTWVKIQYWLDVKVVWIFYANRHFPSCFLPCLKMSQCETKIIYIVKLCSAYTFIVIQIKLSHFHKKFAQGLILKQRH